MQSSELILDTASRNSPAIEELKQPVKNRIMIYQLVRPDILTRYKRSVLGIPRSMLNPLGIILVLTFAFSKIFRFDTAGNSWSTVLSGRIAWNFFSETTTACMNSPTWGGSLFQRIY